MSNATSKTFKYLSNTVWKGSFLNGSGMVTSGGNAFKKGLPIEVPILARGGPNDKIKEDMNKTNPEELVVSAHSSCFTLTLSGILSVHNLKPTKLETNGSLTLEKKTDGFKISSIHLVCTGEVPGLTNDKFKEYAEIAKKNCPMSKLFHNNCEISLDAKLT